VAVIAVAAQSSVGVYDDVLFSVHMVQHLLLIMVAPPLLICGRPATLLLRMTRGRVRSGVRDVLRSRAVSLLSWPPMSVTLYAAAVIGTHLTPLMDLVLENAAFHNAEHAVYLVVGYLYFLPVIGSEPIRWRPSVLGRYLLLLITMPVDTAVGVTLMLMPRELFPAYARAGRPWGPSPLTDLHHGGLIMFTGSDLIMAGLAVVLAARLVRAREVARHGRPSDLDAYNVYLAGLSGRDV
jgi:putative copper resistance protein D